MGGYGSGWQGSRKTTVEECLTLSIKRLVDEGAIAPGCQRSGTWSWSYPGEQPHAQISYTTQTLGFSDPWFRISARVGGAPVDYRIGLETTLPNFGGLRWWFICPRSGRRAANLYLPPGERYFAHRDAYGLTYRSCQESGQSRALYRRLAAQMGTSEATVRSHLKAGRVAGGGL